MAYEIKVQLRDTVLEFTEEDDRNSAYADVIQELRGLGIPDDNIIVRKIDNDQCSLGHNHHTVIEQFGE